MAISCFPQIFFISILSTIISITDFTHAYSRCPEDQKMLLLELKNELKFDPYASTKLVHWNQTHDCCSWEGVACDGSGHVIGLQLDDEGIYGGIENSSSLFSLRYLEKLNLANNNFNFTQIPRGIQNFMNLTHLNLSNAGFEGQVPVELSYLAKLVSLDISSRSWGNQPLELEHPDLKALIQNLTGLKELSLDSIYISDPGNEWCHAISSSLPDLRILSLMGCNLSGPLDPSLLQLHSLSVLRLDGNNLSTTVPDFFANFSTLAALGLSNCFLKGFVPELIFQVPTLQILDLSYNQLLSGTIPQFPQSRSFSSIVLSATNFSGSLPDTISNLRMLSHIELSGCRFTGQIPSTLANLTELYYVDLSNNFFTGSIPPFYMSKKLAYIDLSNNSLTGSLSHAPFEGLPNLVYINLGYNSLNGSIPPYLFSLPSLQQLILSNNQFSGQVSEFPTLNSSNLYELDLSNNRLEGPIPKSFFQLEGLYSLFLSNNFFNGTSQLEKVSRLSNHTSLDLSYNNLYNFPDLRSQTNFQYLDLSNNRISGEIPSWIWEIGNELDHLNLSCNLLVDLQKPYRIPSSLQVLDLHSNQLPGELPLPPPQAAYVDYSNNNFEKAIPPDIGNLSSYLNFFSAANNSLSGAIPSSLCNATGLIVLDLSVNKLSGFIPPCLLENMPYLGVFNLGSNNIRGEIPDKFPVNCDLETLDLSNNNLEGNIPRSLRNCKGLVVMNVGNNNINDSFPCMLSSSLRVLVLRSNKFHGEVRCHKNWPNLQIIDIASNNFSGTLKPNIFSSWKAMMLGSDTKLRQNHLSFGYMYVIEVNYPDQVTLTIKGSGWKLVKIREDIASIDFSCNNFQGEIPDAVGDLSSLYLLNLSHNTLTGTIPKSFSNLTQLESLDLSVNQLTGMIPVELAGLTFLQVLNLSYNKLVGAIPSGPQFRTFSADSFEENTGLCGFPLDISCSNTTDLSPPKPEPARPHRKMEIEWDYVCAALGYIVGLGSFVWVLLWCGSLRRIYFEKVDEVLEKKFGHQNRKRRHGRGRIQRNQVRRQ